MNVPTRAIRKPEWLKVNLPAGESTTRLREVMRSKNLHTVCEEARCPNMAECWGAGTATFMILGDVCTRSCGFCAVKTGRPTGLDLSEPERVAEAVRAMGIHHAVITSVNRDELADGGASVFAETIRRVRDSNPGITLEVLIPDFRGVMEALDCVIAAGPDVLNHNMETVPRLYTTVRPQARYRRSLDVLHHAKRRGMVTKTGLMLGLGETRDEVMDVLADLRRIGCDVLTLGQYLQPTSRHLPVDRYLAPPEFDSLRQDALSLGFRFVEAGPLVRSSYHAERHVR
jgi:lipoic acid synthetase